MMRPRFPALAPGVIPGAFITGAFVTGAFVTGAPLAASAAPPIGPHTSWAGNGEVAVVSGPHLELVDDNGTVHRAAAPGVPSRPAWSGDGLWVAYLSGPPPGASKGQQSLWVARSDGADAHQVSPAGDVAQFAWAPGSGEKLAFSLVPTPGAKTTVFMGSPASTAPARFGTYAELIGFSWSPDAAALAVSYRAGQPGPGRGVLAVVPVHGHPRTVYRGSGFGDALLAGWWPSGHGLLFWDDPVGSASVAADGLALKSLDLITGKTTTLATTLVHDEWVSWSPDGREVAIVAGGDRELWDWGKHVEVCAVPSGTCRAPALPSPASKWMSLGPAWTATGTLVLTVAPAAPANGSGVPAGLSAKGGWDTRNVDQWYDSQRLYYWQSSVLGSGGGPRPVPASPTGAHDPRAVPGGLLYVRHDALWYMPLVSGDSVSSGPPLQLAGALALGPYGNYFAYIDWASDYAWHGPTSVP